MNICLFAPIGGFGHHVRWMCLLDDQYKFENYPTVESKLNFILNHVYNRTIDDWLEKEDAYSNIDKRYIYFNHQLDRENRIVRLKNQKNCQFFEYTKETKMVCCTMSPQLALKEFSKIKPDLYNWTEQQFLERIEVENDLSIQTKKFHNKFLLMNNDVLADDVLDRDYYTKLIKFLDLDDNYESAATMHLKWRYIRCK